MTQKFTAYAALKILREAQHTIDELESIGEDRHAMRVRRLLKLCRQK